MSGHTPGPWRWLNAATLIGSGKRLPVVLTCGAEHGAMEVRYGSGLLDRLDPSHPDARLIAAAPDLLEACRAALLALEGTTVCEQQEINEDRALDALRTAIEAAEKP